MGGEASSTGGETPPTGGEAPPMGLQSEKSVNSSGDPRAFEDPKNAFTLPSVTAPLGHLRVLTL